MQIFDAPLKLTCRYMILRNGGLMDFGKLRVKSEKIWKDWIDRNVSKHFGYLPENIGRLPLAVVIMTTA